MIIENERICNGRTVAHSIEKRFAPLEIKEHVNSAWQWISKEGPLCEENMRSVKMNLMDVTLHTDSIHRGAGQIAPPMRRCSFAALMTGRASSIFISATSTISKQLRFG